MSSDQDKGYLESAYDKTKDMASKAGEKTKEAATTVKDTVTAPFRSDDTERKWEGAKGDMKEGYEKTKQCGEQKGREAKDYLGQKAHDAGRHIETH